MSDQVTFVVQGPIFRSDIANTREVLQSIRLNFPQAEIVLSTWVGEDVSGLEHDVLVQSEDPGTLAAVSQLENLNRQVVSSVAGLRKATRPVVVKTRTDSYFSSDTLLARWDESPPAEGFYFSRRVGVLPLATRWPTATQTMTYYYSDLAVIGLREDVLRVFNQPLMKPSDLVSVQHFLKAVFKDRNVEIGRYGPEQHFWGQLIVGQRRPARIAPFDFSSHFLSLGFLARELVVLDAEDFGIVSCRFAHLMTDRADRSLVFHHDWQRICGIWRRSDQSLEAQLLALPDLLGQTVDLDDKDNAWRQAGRLLFDQGALWEGMLLQVAGGDTLQGVDERKSFYCGDSGRLHAIDRDCPPAALASLRAWVERLRRHRNMGPARVSIVLWGRARTADWGRAMLSAFEQDGEVDYEVLMPLAPDADPHQRDLFRQFALRSPRFREVVVSGGDWRDEMLTLVRAASGALVKLLGPGDFLAPHALQRLVRCYDTFGGSRFVYCVPGRYDWNSVLHQGPAPIPFSESTRPEGLAAVLTAGDNPYISFSGIFVETSLLQLILHAPDLSASDHHELLGLLLAVSAPGYYLREALVVEDGERWRADLDHLMATCREKLLLVQRAGRDMTPQLWQKLTAHLQAIYLEVKAKLPAEEFATAEPLITQAFGLLLQLQRRWMAAVSA